MIEILNKFTKKFLGKTAWGVKIGYGSFLTIEFGVPNNYQTNMSVHGEWHLWFYLCCWRIEKDGYFIVGSEDTKEKLIEGVKKIEGRKLNSFEICPQTLDLLLTFESNLLLRSFSVIGDVEGDEDKPHWMLYMPDNRVLVAGPGNRWVIEES
ncbi:MAG: hypothetical protein P9F19_00185 [Candidatus Contendobacter sp.]|nr:hypothetical protein [Candidatus Contendobacter sp.]